VIIQSRGIIVEEVQTRKAKKVMNRFEGRVCLITGAASGIGKATALRFASEGGNVVVIDRDEKGGMETVDQISKSNGKAIFVKTDIGNEDDIKASVKATMDKWNRIDVLVNNAAMMTFKKIVDLTSEEWDTVMRVNLRSVFLYCKYCIPHMANGAIVNISSVHAHATTANVVPYASSKGAMEAFIRGVSLEYPREIMRINCIAPGAVDTPMLWSNPNVKSGREKIEGVVGKPEELAAAICFLASEDASYINGQTLIVDGGRLDIL
jgi:NAD(P)-dependent dehydrogenase (short-subunit alcohol dehydrogenase family)